MPKKIVVAVIGIAVVVAAIAVTALIYQGPGKGAAQPTGSLSAILSTSISGSGSSTAYDGLLNVSNVQGKDFVVPFTMVFARNGSNVSVTFGYYANYRNGGGNLTMAKGPSDFTMARVGNSYYDCFSAADSLNTSCYNETAYIGSASLAGLSGVELLNTVSELANSSIPVGAATPSKNGWPGFNCDLFGANLSASTGLSVCEADNIGIANISISMTSAATGASYSYHLFLQDVTPEGQGYPDIVYTGLQGIGIIGMQQGTMVADPAALAYLDVLALDKPISYYSLTYLPIAIAQESGAVVLPGWPRGA